MQLGYIQKNHVSDNEILAEYKKSTKKNNTTFELVPAGTHLRNIAEKAIQAWKAHFISIICGASKKNSHEFMESTPATNRLHVEFSPAIQCGPESVST